MPIFTPDNLRSASSGIILKSDDIERHEARWPIPFVLAGQGADLATTLYGLSKQGEESNPFLPSNVKGITAVKIGAMLGDTYAIHKLQKNHPKAAKLASIAAGTAGIIPALINLYRLNKSPVGRAGY